MQPSRQPNGGFQMEHFPDRPLRRIRHQDIPSDEECRGILSGLRLGTLRAPLTMTQSAEEYRQRARVSIRYAPSGRTVSEPLPPAASAPNLNRINAMRARRQDAPIASLASVYPSRYDPALRSPPPRMQRTPTGALPERCPLCRAATAENGGILSGSRKKLREK
ncbi:hypothetical protein ESCO_006723 [Escovopsis weberi]|uniref:Uncharacterized protein n=1 Tax=Escovopsis weberi TaxID=150374 RepID=A0A0M8N1Q5_ESCWE|nr:hypothetical protein ESCO_006723 [Escovopsis weberi]